MAKIWTDSMVEAAKILAREGYSSKVSAEAMGIKRATLLGRSSRTHEFRFTPYNTGKPFDNESHDRDVAAAKLLIVGIDTSFMSRPLPRHKIKPPKNLQMVPIRESGRPTQPVVSRSQSMVEAPLTESEIQEAIRDEGSNECSVAFSESKSNQCLWIVSRNDLGESMVCGRPRDVGSSYCSSHRKASVSAKQPKTLTSSLVYTWDQSTKLVVPTRKMVSFPPRRS